MNENIKTSVHKYYNTKVPILSHWSTTRNKAATLSPEEYEFLYEIVTTNPVYSKKAKLLHELTLLLFIPYFSSYFSLYYIRSLTAFIFELI